MRGITVCVGYDDYLAITIKTNINILSELCVITSPEDKDTQNLARSYGASVFITDAFTRYGAKFNKGLAMEEGLDFFGRKDWMLILDADIILPDTIKTEDLKIGNLYGMYRRMLENPDWPYLYKELLPIGQDTEFPGYFQLFHADDPALSVRPWYDPTFTHAGGGDAYFQYHWPEQNRVRLIHDTVIHLGPRDTNWYGRVSKRLDDKPIEDAADKSKLLSSLRIFNGWVKSKRIVRNFKDRVTIPNFKSKFKWHRSNPEQ
jgi:hypothetical protein